MLDEEKELAKLKEELDSVPIPLARLDGAIEQGISRAKQKRRRYVWLRSTIIVAVIILSFLSSIRLSPTFASYVSVLPGMEKFVDILRSDKGLVDAVNNEFLQEMNVSDEHNGLKITIDSILADDQRMVVFYTVSQSKDVQYIHVRNVELLSGNGESLDVGFGVDGILNNLSEGDATSKIEFYFDEALPNQFTLHLDVAEANEHFQSVGEAQTYTFPLTINPEVYKDKQKHFALHETVEVEGQKITVKDVTIYPLRTAISFHFDQDNTKEIFGFEDIRIVDRHGQSWGTILNGVTGTFDEDDDVVVFLQSNYFHDAEDLSIVFSKLRALDKDEVVAKIDAQTGEVLQVPEDGLLFDLKLNRSTITYKLKNGTHARFGVFDEVRNAQGKLISSGHDGVSWEASSTIQDGSLDIDRKKLVPGPLSLQIVNYPAIIEGEVKVPIR